MTRIALFVLLACTLALFKVQAASQVDDLKKQVDELRKDVSNKEHEKAPLSQIDSVVGCKYGPHAPVTTSAGKLKIGGLLQVWYQNIDQDHVGIIKAAPGNNLDPAAGAYPSPEPNESSDNSTFRVRRTELRFTLDIHENITAYVMMDPSRESNIMFTPVPTFPLHNYVIGNGALANGSGQQAGNTIIPQLLQDAYINYHGVVPHHDFTIGQFKPPSGEEAWRASGALDFVDRAMVTAVNNVRDIGVMVHGTWIDNRVQYWLGAFNGPEGTVLTDPEIVEGGNRTDDNNDKDIAWRVAVRPIWNQDCWPGRLEVGYARTDGYRGEAGQGFDPALTVNGLDRERTKIYRQAAWLWYRPNGPVKGWWMRGEWGQSHDRYPVSFRTNLLNTGSITDINGYVVGQANPAPVTVQGWYASTGYRLRDSIFSEGLCSGGACTRWMNDLEFAFRYEVFQNIAAEDLVDPDRHTDLFKTQACTFGLNYYLKGYDARIQANYYIVDDPESQIRGLREVKNNVFVVAFQVQF